MNSPLFSIFLTVVGIIAVGMVYRFYFKRIDRRFTEAQTNLEGVNIKTQEILDVKKSQTAKVEYIARRIKIIEENMKIGGSR